MYNYDFFFFASPMPSSLPSSFHHFMFFDAAISRK